MPKEMPFSYQCVHADETGGRCQDQALMEGERPFSCIEHLKLDNPPVAPAPEWVLFQFMVSEKFREKYLEGSGIPEIIQDSLAKREKRIADAERLGRNPNHFFPKRAYNGSPVFGKNGLENVGRLYLLRQELGEAGYKWVNEHWYERKTEKVIGRKKIQVTGAVVVFGFRKNPEGFYGICPTPDGEKLFEMLVHQDGYSYAHVHANAPDENGEILHSIELLGRKEGQAEKCRLVPTFMDGMWYAVPRAVEEMLRETSVEA